MLVLLAGLARAGLVAADLAPACRVVRVALQHRPLAGHLRRRKAERRAGAAEAAAALPVAEVVLAGRRIEVLGEHRRESLRLGGLEHHLEPHQLTCDILAQMP